MKLLYPGTRVKVFDHRLFINDVSTPLKTTMRAATVKKWYGERCGWPNKGAVNGNLIDVEFDHRPEEVSKGHFADHIEVLDA
jgi:hypothetical protein